MGDPKKVEEMFRLMRNMIAAGGGAPMAGSGGSGGSGSTGAATASGDQDAAATGPTGVALAAGGMRTPSFAGSEDYQKMNQLILSLKQQVICRAQFFLPSLCGTACVGSCDRWPRVHVVLETRVVPESNPRVDVPGEYPKPRNKHAGIIVT